MYVIEVEVTDAKGQIVWSQPRPLADLLSGLNWMRVLPAFLAGAEGGR